MAATKHNWILWSAMALAGLDCALRIAVLGYWAFAPERVPDIPLFTKGIHHPEVQAGVLVLALPAMAVLAWQQRLSPRQCIILGATLTAIAGAAFVAGLFLSFNVVSGWAFLCLGQALTVSGAQRGRGAVV